MSVPKKRIPSEVVYYYCAWYSFFGAGVTWSPLPNFLISLIESYPKDTTFTMLLLFVLINAIKFTNSPANKGNNWLN